MYDSDIRVHVVISLITRSQLESNVCVFIHGFSYKTVFACKYLTVKLVENGYEFCLFICIYMCDCECLNLITVKYLFNTNVNGDLIEEIIEQ